MQQQNGIKLYVGGKEIRPNDTFEATFHVCYRANRLYLIARSDTGMVIMPEVGSPVYARAAKYNVIEAKCVLKKIVQTQRNTAFAVARILDWEPVI